MPSESDKWGWKHVSVFGGFDKGSGVGVKSCPAIDRSLREAFQILEEERLARKKKRTSGSGKTGKRIRTSQPSVTCVWKTIAKEDVDDIVARFFYADGLDFNIVNSPYFLEMTKAIAAFGPGYEPPTTEKLSDLFLSKEKAKIEKAMALVRESWPHTGCTILCVNRLCRTQGRYYANIFVSSPRGLMFLKALDINDGDGMDNMFVDVLSDAIMEVEPTNVLQIISNLGHFPHLFWSPCTSHSICVLMEDVTKLDWIKPIVLCAKEIDECILTYQRSSLCVLALESSDPLSTKFAPSYCIVERIFELKQALLGVVVSEEWKQWKLTIQEDVLNVETAILGDNFWSRACSLLQFFEPFALEAVKSKGVDDILLNQLELLIESKWDILFSPLHASGYILNPKYFGKGQSKDKTIMRGWKATLDRYESDSATRRVLREQLSSYWRLEGSFGEEDAVDCRDKMDPVAWWENFGFETPHLQTLAIKILSQVSSVSMYQETWQDNEFLCQTAVNRLGVERVEDLVFVRNNLRLHSQRNGNSSSSPGNRNQSSSPASGDKTWESVHIDQMKGIVILTSGCSYRGNPHPKRNSMARFKCSMQLYLLTDAEQLKEGSQLDFAVKIKPLADSTASCGDEVAATVSYFSH
ncbi:hypothetical protein AAG906_037967 [Vitis piasezkii]